MKRLLFVFFALLSIPGFVAAQCTVVTGTQCVTDQHCTPTGSDSTTALQNAVDAAAVSNCTVFLDRGPMGQDTYVLSQTIVLPGTVTITKWPDAPGTITIQAGTNIDPDTTTTFCAHPPGNPGTRNVFCSSGKDFITIADLNFVPFSGVTVVKNPPDPSSGREVWAVKNGGSTLIFRDNTVSNFTDALFVEGGGSFLHFLNNGVNLADRYPLSCTCSNNVMCSCGGNAAFTVAHGSGAQSNVEFDGNTVVGPGASIARAFAVVGGIVYDDQSQVTSVEMKNNRVSQCDHGLFISAIGNCGTATCDNTVSGNTGSNNGNGLTISRGNNPSGGPSCSPAGPSPLPASGMSITKNTFNSNNYDGGCIASYTGVPGNPSPSLIMNNNIFNGNKNQCLENYSGVGPNGSSPGNNICRGPGNNGPPPAPPGKGVNPGRGTT